MKLLNKETLQTFEETSNYRVGFSQGYTKTNLSWKCLFFPLGVWGSPDDHLQHSKSKYRIQNSAFCFIKG